MISLFGEAQVEQAVTLGTAAIALGTLLANAWGIWVRRLEKKDELAAANERAENEAGIVELRAEVKVVREDIKDCHDERTALKDEVKGLRDMILGRHVEPKQKP